MRKVILALIILPFAFSCQNKKENETTQINISATVSQVMDSVITRLYAQVPVEKYDSIDEKFMLNFSSMLKKNRYWLLSI
jgi:hypothetical protein